MNYFYTITLGITVLFVNYFKDKNLHLSIGVCMGISMLLLLLFIYSFFAYTSVRKASGVLKHYENVMQTIRKLYYRNESSLDKLYVRNTIENSKFLSKLYSVQNTSELTLLGTMVVISVIEIITYVFFFQITNSDSPMRNILWFNFMISVLIYLIIIQDRFSKKN